MSDCLSDMLFMLAGLIERSTCGFDKKVIKVHAVEILWILSHASTW